MLSATAWKLPEILPLENGDRLTREEFGYRYEFMPGVKKAELHRAFVQQLKQVSDKKRR